MATSPMTATERAIRDSIKGGWLPHSVREVSFKDRRADGHCRTTLDYKVPGGQGMFTICDQEVFLEPEFWQALGRARSWSRGIDPETGKTMIADPSEVCAQDVAEDNCHRLVAYLFEGKSIEDFFISLEG